MAHAAKTSGAEAAADIKKDKPKSLFQQMVDDKKVASNYVRGKVNKNDLHARGIKFVKPI